MRIFIFEEKYYVIYITFIYIIHISSLCTIASGENIALVERETFIVGQLITAAPTPNVNLMSKGNTPLGLT